jgi:hypothetical protein
MYLFHALDLFVSQKAKNWTIVIMVRISYSAFVAVAAAP